MAHAKSLRVIGQSLEVAKLVAFDLDTDGPNYVLKSDYLSKTGEWILRHALNPHDISEHDSDNSTVMLSVRFSPADISRLDDQARKQRRISSYLHTQAYSRLSQLLRALGGNLDRTEVRVFNISWRSDSVSVVFQSENGLSDTRTFTTEKLQQLVSQSRFRRSNQARIDTNSPGFVKQTRPRNR